MCKEYCGSDHPINKQLPVGELVYFHDYFDRDRYSLNPWKIVSVELKSGCAYYGLESGNTHTTVTGNSIRSYADQLPKYDKKTEPPTMVLGGVTYVPAERKSSTYRLIFSKNNKTDPSKMLEFQEEYCNLEYCNLIKNGVPPHEIVRNWNDSQDSFWNKVYLVEESK